MRYPFTPSRIATIRKTKNTEYWWGSGETRSYNIVGENIKCHSHSENKDLAISYKVKHKSVL